MAKVQRPCVDESELFKRLPAESRPRSHAQSSKGKNEEELRLCINAKGKGCRRMSCGARLRIMHAAAAQLSFGVIQLCDADLRVAVLYI